MNELTEFDAKLGRWALLFGGPLWMATSVYQLAHSNAPIFPACLLFFMGVVAFVGGIFAWRFK